MLLDLFRGFIDPLALMVLKLGRSNVMEAVVKADDFVSPKGELDQEGVVLQHRQAAADDSEENMEEVEQGAFTRELQTFCREKNVEFKHPKFYGDSVDLLKLWREVTKLGGYDAVCAKKLWKHVGKRFDPPKTCTSLSFTFRVFYQKALLEYERYRLRELETTDLADFMPSPRQTAVELTRTKRIRKDGKARIESKRIRSGLNRLMNSKRFKPCCTSQRYSGTSPSVTSSDTRPIESGHEVQHASPHSDEIQGNNNEEEEESHGKSLMERDGKLSWRKLRRRSDTSIRELTKQKHHPRTRKRSVCPTGVEAWTSSREEQEEECKDDIGPSPVEKLKAVVADDTPGTAEGIKINAYETRDDYQIYALVPGLKPSELRIECESSGRVVIVGSPRQPRNLWGVTGFRKVINLPSKIDAGGFQARVSLYGQLLLRVPILRETRSTKKAS